MSLHVEQSSVVERGRPSWVVVFFPSHVNEYKQPGPVDENKLWQSLMVCAFFPDGFHGDVYLTIKLLLPGIIKIVYNLNDKQIVKLFSRIFNCSQEEMVRDLEQVST